MSNQRISSSARVEIPGEMVVKPEARVVSSVSKVKRKSDKKAYVAPWWSVLPSLLGTTVSILLLPFKSVIYLAELIISVCVLAVIGASAAWWTGYLSDDQIVGLVRPVGEKLLSMVQSVGYL